MDDVITVHLKVPRPLWMALRADAMGRGRSAQEHVVGMFSVAYGVSGGLRAGKADGDAQRRGVIPQTKNDKVTLDVTGVSKSPALSPSLKEGYGWCMACKVKQVKLPNILCKECEKP